MRTAQVSVWEAWAQTPLVELKIKGLGAKTKEKLIAAGLVTAWDLVSFLPRDYLDYSQIFPIDQAPIDVPVHIRGRILSKNVSKTHNRRITVLEALVDDGQATLRLVWFNQAFLNGRLKKGDTYSFFGKIRWESSGRTMNSPRFSEQPEADSGGIQPVYREVRGLKSERLSTYILAVLAQMPDRELGPELPTLKQALQTLHAPADGETVAAIRARQAPALTALVYDEFFQFQIRLQHLVRESQNRDHPVPSLKNGARERFLDAVPFQPTGDQIKTFDFIDQTLEKGGRLYGLVQGDVGCGKTLIGFYAAYLFALAGYQSVMLCPTSVLATQHALGATKLLEPLGLKVRLLSGKLSGAALREALAEIAAGDIDFVVGTHKVFQADVAFANLGLALIDEQHRFGVEQRRALLKKGRAAHYLAFSATPIPRSLAMTLYGDFQILSIKEKPADRIPIRTILKKAENREQVADFVRRRLDSGEQVYWVFPMVEEREEMEERSVEAMFRQFLESTFRGYAVDMAHGKMPKEELENVMNNFREGRTQLLVATTVVEVGVDVANAAVMVIDGAERFGLSQLHQLRGRVGRGELASYCFLLLHDKPSRETVERMRFLEKSTDGFEISQFDLEQRGSGQVLGKAQSGEAGFRFGDPWLDRDWMASARQAAIRALG